jgi:putative intracellular protease/amidase
MKPDEPMTPEDLELKRVMETLAEGESPNGMRTESLKKAIRAFREKLPEHDYVRALDPASFVEAGSPVSDVRSGDAAPFHAPRRRLTIALLLFNDLVALDAVGPYEVLSVLGGVEFKFVAKEKGPLRAARGRLGLIADYSIDEVPSADILLIPGGAGAETMQHDPEVLDWVRRIHQNATWTCSACTGSLILGAAGVLKGKRATTHWASLDRLAGYGAVAVRERVVVDDGIVTGAGVSAGLDMGLVMAALLRGEDAAQTVQLHLEYDPKPPFNAGSPATAPEHIRESVMARLRASRAAAPPLEIADER